MAVDIGNVPPTTSGSSSSTVPSPAIVASWAVASTRWYAVDPINGSDANAGYSDVSMAAAGLVAKKTWVGLLAVIPISGNGHTVVIAMGANTAGATYGEDLVLDGCVGYADITMVATTDFSDTATDRLLSGFVQSAVGPGGSGEWTCDVAPTVSAFTVTAGTLPAGTAGVGKRVRFTGNVTAALANQCRAIQGNTASVVTLLTDLSVSPAAGDTFFIEGPGVLFTNVRLAGVHARGSVILRGVASTALFRIVDCGGVNGVTIGGCESATAVIFRSCISSFTVSTAPGPGGSVGMGLRAVTTLDITDVRSLTLGGLAVLTATTIRGVREMSQTGAVFRGNVSFQACGGALGTSSSFGFQFGRASAGSRDTLIDGGHIVIQGVVGLFQNIVIQNAGASAAIIVDNCEGNNCTFVSVTGSTGNTARGFSAFSASFDGIYRFTTTTVTGTSGDALVGNASTALSWSDLALTNVIDAAGNNYIGSAGVIVTAAHQANNAGVALAPGEIVRSSGTSDTVTSATGNSATIGDSSFVGVVLNTCTSAQKPLIVAAGYAYCKFDGAPTVGAIAYLSPGTIRTLTTTVPAVAANNNRLRVGRVVSASGSTGIVALAPETLAIVATGTA